MRVDMHVDMHVDMRADMCVDMRVDMCVDRRVDMCVGMRMDMSVDMRVDTCAEMRVGMLFPGIDDNGSLVGEMAALTTNLEFSVGATGLEKHMAGTMGMRDKGAVHLEQCNPPEPPLEYTSRL